MVNGWNQKIGKKVYNKLLDCSPTIALVNEMAYSAGVVEHYSNNGYDAIIMEWNNPRKYKSGWKNEWRYFPQIALGTGDTSQKLIWADSIIFQKFQRYVHGDYHISKYLAYLRGLNCEYRRFLPLYSNDVEIFDYRPGRYHNEPKLNSESEWTYIIDFYSQLLNEDWAELVRPSEVAQSDQSNYSHNKIRLESPEQPIPVKKQEKYNINRWALTGKDDLEINTKCYQIHEHLTNSNNIQESDWKELCYLWSSDFRTHITEKRWLVYQERLESAIPKKYAVIKHTDSKKKVLQTLPFSKKGIEVFEKNSKLFIENKNISLVLDKSKGLSVFQCAFKNIHDREIFGNIEHGYFDDISFSEEYYSGHSMIERLGQHNISDLGKVKPNIFLEDSSICISSEQKAETFWGDFKTQQQTIFQSTISIQDSRIIFNKTISFQEDIWWRAFLGMAVIKPFSITFNPEEWDLETLYYMTKNGGCNYEVYNPVGKQFNHSDIHSSLISSKHALGSTDGTIIVGDSEKKITIKCNMPKLALIPSIIFNPEGSKYFFRIQYSAREIDETVSKKIDIRPLEFEFIIE